MNKIELKKANLFNNKNKNKMPTLTSNFASVILNWTKADYISNIHHYRVYMDSKIIGNIDKSNNSYTVTKVTLYDEHSFYIEAINDKNNIKSKSNIIYISFPRANDLSINLNINI